MDLLKWHPITANEIAIEEVMTDIRQDATDRLNRMRGTAKYRVPEVEHAKELISKFYPDLSEDSRQWYGIHPRKRGDGVLWSKVSWTQVMSVYVMVFNEDGTLRLNSKGDFIGVAFVKRLLKMHPYHGKAGTARSNIMYYGLRPRETHETGVIIESDDGKKIKETIHIRNQDIRTSLHKCIKELVKNFRDAA